MLEGMSEYTFLWPDEWFCCVGLSFQQRASRAVLFTTTALVFLATFHGLSINKQ